MVAFIALIIAWQQTRGDNARGAYHERSTGDFWGVFSWDGRLLFYYGKNPYSWTGSRWSQHRLIIDQIRAHTLATRFRWTVMNSVELSDGIDWRFIGFRVIRV